MARIRIANVRKDYGSVPALHGISVDIADGEFVVLVGPSGCGKSTLLRMIAGLESVSSGQIWIDDRVVNNVSPRDRDIAMVFQNYALYPHMSVAANMGFSLKLRRSRPDDIRSRVSHAANLLALTPLLERYPRQLSGGQRQRVAMGRAIVRDPKVFLFDEPLSNLDAKLRVQMRTEIKSMHQRLKTTTLYVTHDQVEAMTLGDKVVVMHDGIVEQVGAPLDLYDTPANIFVAGFIGSPAMNVLPGRLSVAERSFTTKEGTVFALDAVPILPPNETGAGMTLGIRPEHLVIDAERGVPAIVNVVEPTGSETQVHASIGGHDVTALVRERVTARPGDRILLRPLPRHIHLFDPRGRRLDFGAAKMIAA